MSTLKTLKANDTGVAHFAMNITVHEPTTITVHTYEVNGLLITVNICNESGMMEEVIVNEIEYEENNCPEHGTPMIPVLGKRVDMSNLIGYQLSSFDTANPEKGLRVICAELEKAEARH